MNLNVLAPASDTPRRQITSADAPFDDPDADITLLTSDNVQFRVYKTILSVASPVFKTMFTLPQSLAEGGEVPNIDLVEGSTTLDKVLRFCYPFDDPIIDDLDALQLVLQVMMKYDMTLSMARARRHLLGFAPGEPLRVYATACRYGWKDVAGMAAKETLKSPCGSEIYVKELEHITGGMYYRLRDYHKKCGMAAAAIYDKSTQTYTWMDPGAVVGFRCTSISCVQFGFYVTPKDGVRHLVRNWFMGYLEKACEALKSCPSTKTVIDPALLFPFLKAAYKCSVCEAEAFEHLLRFASGEFAKRIEQVVSEVDLGLEF